MAQHAHLLRIETGQPRILAYLVIDELNSHGTRYLHGLLAFLTTVEPGLRPPAVAGGISIDGGGTADIIALGIENLKAGQRVYEIAIGGCLLISFFF